MRDRYPLGTRVLVTYDKFVGEGTVVEPPLGYESLTTHNWVKIDRTVQSFKLIRLHCTNCGCAYLTNTNLEPVASTPLEKMIQDYVRRERANV